MLLTLCLLIFHIISVFSYHSIYTVTNLTKEAFEDVCTAFDFTSYIESGREKMTQPPLIVPVKYRSTIHKDLEKVSPAILPRAQYSSEDPMEKLQKLLDTFLYGLKLDSDHDDREREKKIEITLKKKKDLLVMFPTGSIMRAERFNNKCGVHMPISEYMHRGHCRLNITNDYMQTAVNAFSIFLEGTVEDVLHLPAEYVLHSARTIAMMKITLEKSAATWTVVKGNRQANEVPYETLELYRPLFKYLNGKEMARLNLSDERILTYIGTHAELDRHQVGVVASSYIKFNRNWSNPRYLNQMNNLLCGVPMSFMRRVPESLYLQLTDQVFYHIRACDPLQRRFYLAMMTRSQVLGKSYSWSARDVARLGLLLAEVEGNDLAAINPEAMSGITAHVMMEMQPQNLRYITELQTRYMGQKTLIILSTKLKEYYDHVNMPNIANHVALKNHFVLYVIMLIDSQWYNKYNSS